MIFIFLARYYELTEKKIVRQTYEPNLIPMEWKSDISGCLGWIKIL